MNIPNELKYTKDHEWVAISDNIATIGITDYAQGELGDIIFVEFPEPGDSFEADDSVGTVEAVKTVADIFTPLGGEITEVNTAIEDCPDLINNDPYGAGWLLKIQITADTDLSDLMSAEKYQELIG